MLSLHDGRYKQNCQIRTSVTDLGIMSWHGIQFSPSSLRIRILSSFGEVGVRTDVRLSPGKAAAHSKIYVKLLMRCQATDNHYFHHQSRSNEQSFYLHGGPKL